MRPFLGVQTVTLTPRLAAQLGIRADAGALVTETVEGGPAAGAGVEPGEAITALAGTPIRSTRDLVAALRAHRPGESVAVTLAGTGGARSLELKLADSPA